MLTVTVPHLLDYKGAGKSYELEAFSDPNYVPSLDVYARGGALELTGAFGQTQLLNNVSLQADAGDVKVQGVLALGRCGARARSGSCARSTSSGRRLSSTRVHCRWKIWRRSRCACAASSSHGARAARS